METRVVISLGYGGGKACLGHKGGEMSSGVVFSKEEVPGVGDYVRVLSSRCNEVRGRCAPEKQLVQGILGVDRPLSYGSIWVGEIDMSTEIRKRLFFFPQRFTCQLKSGSSPRSARNGKIADE